MLFVCFISYWRAFLRTLTVWSNVELVQCQCVLTTCITRSYLISTHSINFLTSAMQAPSMSIYPDTSPALRTYKRSMSALGLHCPCTFSISLVFLPNSCTSSWFQLIIPKLHLGIGIANVSKYYNIKSRRMNQTKHTALTGLHTVQNSSCKTWKEQTTR
jgi:hypothetical protein